MWRQQALTAHSLYPDTTANHGCGVGLDASEQPWSQWCRPSLPSPGVRSRRSLLGLYILHLLAMAGFLMICGVPREEIAKWALKQAGRQRLTDLIRAARGKLPPGDT
ncbi:MAG: hypothetical protein M3460_15400 [Actinomycetota bacterium]|nr:hypothetical protein [Actinomycetota bacterium]